MIVIALASDGDVSMLPSGAGIGLDLHQDNQGLRRRPTDDLAQAMRCTGWFEADAPYPIGLVLGRAGVGQYVEVNGAARAPRQK